MLSLVSMLSGSDLLRRPTHTAESKRNAVADALLALAEDSSCTIVRHCGNSQPGHEVLAVDASDKEAIMLAFWGQLGVSGKQGLWDFKPPKWHTFKDIDLVGAVKGDRRWITTGRGRTWRLSRCQPSPFATTFEAEFNEPGLLGLQFSRDSARALTVEAVAEVGLARRERLIRPGCVLLAVQGQPMQDIEYDVALATIRNASRPLQMTFEYAPECPDCGMHARACMCNQEFSADARGVAHKIVLNLMHLFRLEDHARATAATKDHGASRDLAVVAEGQYEVAKVAHAANDCVANHASGEPIQFASATEIVDTLESSPEGAGSGHEQSRSGTPSSSPVDTDTDKHSSSRKPSEFHVGVFSSDSGANQVRIADGCDVEKELRRPSHTRSWQRYHRRCYCRKLHH